MDIREALQTIMVDIMSDPDFERKVQRAKLLKNARPLSQMGVSAKQKAEEFLESEEQEAFEALHEFMMPKSEQHFLKGEKD